MPPRPGPLASAPGMSAKRIKKEIADLSRENLGAITLAPNESNIFLWKATIPGPTGSPYEGGVFEVDIRVPEDYPFSPPHLQFVTKLYHCNVASTGAICLDLLKHAWSPALSLYKVILSLSSLLTDPNPADPLVPAIAQEYRRDRKKHDATAREWVKKYAMPRIPDPPAPASAAAKPSFSATSRRPGPISRPGSSTPAPTPAPAQQTAGTRRRAPIDIEDGEADGDQSIEIIDITSTNAAHRTNGHGAASTTANRGERAAKRSRVNGSGTVATTGANGSGSGSGSAHRGTSAGDAIVIDE